MSTLEDFFQFKEPVELVCLDTRTTHQTGIARYATNITAEFANLNSSLGHIVLVEPNLAFEEISLPGNWQIEAIPAKRFSLSEFSSLRADVRRLGADLYHSFHYLCSPSMPCPFIVTIHDAYRLDHPETCYTDAEFIRKFGISKFLQLSLMVSSIAAGRRPPRPAAYQQEGRRLRGQPMFFRYLTMITSEIVASASKVVTVSNASKAALVNRIGISEDHIVVVPGAVNQKDFYPRDVEEVVHAKKKYRIEGNYLLYVGLWHKQKNLRRLIDAFTRFSKLSLDTTIKLVIVGKPQPEVFDLEGAVRASHIRELVVTTGYVPDNDLAALYSGALALIVPSLAEGFGLPALEALSCGTLVIAAAIPALKETLGTAGIYFDPLRSSELTEKMLDVCSHRDVLISKLHEAKLDVLRRFSWRSSARKLLETYNEVLRDRSCL